MRKILIIYGSLNPVPSPEGIAPAKIIYETAIALQNKYLIQVLSNYNNKLKYIQYDQALFKHTKANITDKLLLILLKVVIPYKRRKELFINGDDKTLLYFLSVCRWLFFNKPSLVVVHVSTGLALMIKAFFPKLPLLYYHHGTSLHSKLTDNQWRRLISGNTKGIISVNKISLELANSTFSKKLPTEKKFTIYNGLNSSYSINDLYDLKKAGREIYNFSPNDFIIAFAGRFSPEKGIYNLLQSFSLLLNELNKDNLHLLIIGGPGGIKVAGTESDYMKMCKKYAKTHNLPVHFTGFLSGDSLKQAMASADVGILPTDISLSLEGQPLAILEFFSLGVPMIATNVGGVPETIEDGIDGLILNSYPYIEELTNKIKFLYENPKEVQVMRQKAYASFKQKFTIEKMSNSFEVVLNQIKN